MPARRADANASARTTARERTRSAHAEAGARVGELRALADDPPAQRALAERIVRTSKHLEVVRAAIGVIGSYEDPAYRPLLHELYAKCDTTPERSDSGGILRATIVRALQPIVHNDDRPLLQRALASYQMLGLYELCAELRTAALLALNDLDPDLAGLYAARFLTDPRNSNAGEPALSSLRLLAAQQQLGPVLSVASWDSVASFSGGNGEIIGEALRQLTGLPASMLPLLVERHRESEDEQILLGLIDLLLAHPARAEWRDEIVRFLRSTPSADLFAIVTMQIVAARDEPLIGTLRSLAEGERDPARAAALTAALAHA